MKKSEEPEDARGTVSGREAPAALRVACVTGGSRGVGAALVKMFRERGWLVAACASSAKSAKSCAADLDAACDVRDPEACRAFVAATVARFGRLDILINNAGIAGTNPLAAEGSDAMWHEIIAVSLHGTYYMCKAAMPHLPGGTGRIINIASVLGEHGVPDQTAYCAAKHGVVGFTRALAQHLAPRRITVNAICPGWVNTDMARGRMQEIGLRESDLASSVPMGRFVAPEEVAALAFYLGSPEATMITGQALTMDGGSFP